MKRKTLLFFLLTLLFSCKDEEIQYTGNLVVSAGELTSFNGTPIGRLSVGLFDIGELQQPFANPDHALETKSFSGSKIEFKGINPGYVVAIIYSDDDTYKTVQVKAGQTTTLDFFD